MKFTQLALATALSTTLLATPLSALAQSKKELVQKLLVSQQPLVDNAAQNLAERPAAQLAAESRQVLQQAVPPEKREATAKQVDVEIKKYLDFAVPLFKSSAVKLSASNLAPALEEKFSEDELKQIITILDSPTFKKYQAAIPELISPAFLEKVVLDVRSQLDPKLQSVQNNLRSIFNTATGGKVGGPSASEPATKPAAKGAPKK